MDINKEKNILLNKRKTDLDILEYLLIFQKEQKEVYFYSSFVKVYIEKRL